MKRLFLIIVMVLSCLVVAGQSTGSSDADNGLGGVVTMKRQKKDKSTSPTEKQVIDQTATDVDVEVDTDTDIDFDSDSETEDDSLTLSDVFLILILLSSIIGFFVFCNSNANRAEARGLSRTLWLMLSILFTPILACIPLFFINEK